MNPHLATEALPTTQNLAAVIISQVYLSKNQWKYKLGLAGYEKQLYAEAPESASYVWHNICLPTKHSLLHSSQSTFPAPLGTDPVVV
nr:beta-galactosidase 7-like isoform X1 [Ziziphus jujuba var. spinosa]